jgi:hypothetical protein
MSDFTPGPWMILFDDDEIEIISNAGSRSVPVADIMLDEHTTFAPPMIEARANARLICAAPDLLAALIEASDPIGGYMHGPALERARAAIAKARGKL